MKRFTLTFALLAALSIPALAHPTAEMHGDELGAVLGICDPAGKPRNASLQGRTQQLGKIFSKLIDNPSGCAKILQEVNDEIYNICTEKRNFGAYRDVREKELRNLQSRLQNIVSADVSPRQLRELIAMANTLQDIPGMDAEVSNIKSELQFLRKAAEDAEGKLNFREQKRLESEARQLQKIAERAEIQTVVLQRELTSLKENQRFFSYGHYGHRLFFHWGWDQEPENSAPIRDRIAATRLLLKKYLPPDNPQIDMVEKSIYQKLHAEWEDRQSDARIALQTTLKGATPEQLDTLLNLGCAIHILGDYSDTELDALQDAAEIKESLARLIHSRNRVWDFRDKRSRKQLDAISGNIIKCSGDYPQQAKSILKLLKTELPPIIAETNKMKKLLWQE